MNITRPTFLLDKSKVLKNIERMSLKAKNSNVLLRPHFKTHQSAEIGNWFRDFGIEAITVSSVDMANYFADNGWNDITIAFPVNINQYREIDGLAAKINLNILVENIEVIEFLEKKLNNPVGVFIKIDTGYHRTGIDSDNFDAIMAPVNCLKECEKLIFIGFLTHAGHTYSAKTIEEINDIAKTAMDKMLALKLFFKPHFPMLQLSWGDTPSCSIADDFFGFDEIRPGNFVFYDEMQTVSGSCHIDDVAIAMACPVVATHTKRNEVVIYGGAVHFSKEYLKIKDNPPYYGRVLDYKSYLKNEIKTIGYIRSLSQEHGIIQIENNETVLKPGDTAIIIPIHSCLTANLMKQYTEKETGKVIGMSAFVPLMQHFQRQGEKNTSNNPIF